MAKTNQVLKEEHYQRLNKLLKACAETREFLQGCKSCHLDVDKEDDMNEEQMKIATAIKAFQFPNKV